MSHRQTGLASYERDVKCTGQDKGGNLQSVVSSHKEYKIAIKMKDAMLECGS